MNRELEALIKAFIAAHECELRHRSLLRDHYEALLEEALQNAPGVSREVFYARHSPPHPRLH
jgi:hypothetical protein